MLSEGIEIILGKNIRKLRKEKGLTQAQLAEMIDVDKNLVQRWETGTFPKLANIKAISKALEVKEDKLFFNPTHISSLDALEVICRDYECTVTKM